KTKTTSKRKSFLLIAGLKVFIFGETLTFIHRTICFAQDLALVGERLLFLGGTNWPKAQIDTVRKHCLTQSSPWFLFCKTDAFSLAKLFDIFLTNAQRIAFYHYNKNNATVFTHFVKNLIIYFSD
ncbi:MAG: hypothetical protein IKV34_00475, partial [Clostridia bacterium]|nr:hypothetical protein [Clostridia bacterium]